MSSVRTYQIQCDARHEAPKGKWYDDEGGDLCPVIVLANFTGSAENARVPLDSFRKHNPGKPLILVCLAPVGAL